MALYDVLTPKQAEVLHTYLTAPCSMIVLNGAVRAGKTRINNYLFLYEIKRVAKQARESGDRHPQYILAGATSGSIENNVLAEISRQFGIDLKADKHGHYHLFGVDIVPVYTHSITGLTGARGFTSYGAYINEATLANEEVFTEIRNRCSMPGSHIIVDTNPDIPTHWLKREYIDNEDPAAGIVSFNFTIDDNTFLDPQYVATLKAATPRGMFYDRNIRGLWVTGDGIVYQDFDGDRMVKPNLAASIPQDATFYAGVDWGYEHLGSIVVMADYGGKTYLLEENTEQFKEIDYWVARAKEVKRKYGNIRFYADSARPEHVARFNREGLRCINASKSVLSGIEEVASLMKQGRFYVDSGAHGFLNEVYEYIWDEKTGMPVKQHDDCMDAVRYAIYSQHHKSVSVRTFKY